MKNPFRIYVAAIVAGSAIMATNISLAEDRNDVAAVANAAGAQGERIIATLSRATLVDANARRYSKPLYGSATLDFDLSDAADEHDTGTITVADAKPGDPVVLAVPSAAVTNGVVYEAYVSAAGTVTVRASRTTEGSHFVFDAGIHDWAGGAATADSISVTGLEATDVVQATLVARNSTETLVLAANDAGNDQIDLTLSANGTDTTTKIAYSVLRAVSADPASATFEVIVLTGS